MTIGDLIVTAFPSSVVMLAQILSSSRAMVRERADGAASRVPT